MVRSPLHNHISRLDERPRSVGEDEFELAKEDEAVVERDGAVHWREVLGRHVDVADDRALCRTPCRCVGAERATLENAPSFVSSPIGSVRPSTACE